MRACLRWLSTMVTARKEFDLALQSGWNIDLAASAFTRLAAFSGATHDDFDRLLSACITVGGSYHHIQHAFSEHASKVVPRPASVHLVAAIYGKLTRAAIPDVPHPVIVAVDRGCRPHRDTVDLALRHLLQLRDQQRVRRLLCQCHDLQLSPSTALWNMAILVVCQAPDADQDIVGLYRWILGRGAVLRDSLTKCILALIAGGRIHAAHQVFLTVCERLNVQARARRALYDALPDPSSAWALFIRDRANGSKSMVPTGIRLCVLTGRDALARRAYRHLDQHFGENEVKGALNALISKLCPGWEAGRWAQWALEARVPLARASLEHLFAICQDDLRLSPLLAFECLKEGATASDAIVPLFRAGGMFGNPRAALRVLGVMTATYRARLTEVYGNACNGLAVEYLLRTGASAVMYEVAARMALRLEPPADWAAATRACLDRMRRAQVPASTDLWRAIARVCIRRGALDALFELRTVYAAGRCDLPFLFTKPVRVLFRCGRYRDVIAQIQAMVSSGYTNALRKAMVRRAGLVSALKTGLLQPCEPGPFMGVHLRRTLMMMLPPPSDEHMRMHATAALNGTMGVRFLNDLIWQLGRLHLPERDRLQRSLDLLFVFVAGSPRRPHPYTLLAVLWWCVKARDVGNAVRVLELAVERDIRIPDKKLGRLLCRMPELEHAIILPRR
ncbi:Pentacotripeptide-repeat region of PRORP domain-containing protein [Plasmodiophora brassicae]